MASILGSFKPLQPHGYRLAPDAASPAELGTGGWPWALWCFLAQASPSLCVSLWDVIWPGASVPLTVQVRKPKPLKAQPVSVRAPSEPPCSPLSPQYWFYFEERFESHRPRQGTHAGGQKAECRPVEQPRPRAQPSGTQRGVCGRPLAPRKSAACWPAFAFLCSELSHHGF